MLDKNKNPVKHNKTLLEWEAPEFIRLEKSKIWYMAVGGIMFGLILYSLMDHAFTMTIGLILVIVLFMLKHKKPPRLMKVRITELGIEYGNENFAYHNIQAFWIIYKDPYVRSLYLKTGDKQNRFIHIELNHQDPAKVRQLLSHELPEIEGAGQPFLDILSRLLRLS